MLNATLTVDSNGQILTWSADAESMLGYSGQDAIGQPVEMIIPPHLRAPHNAGFRRYLKTGVSRLPEIVTTSALHKSGVIVRLQISVRPVRGTSGNIIAVDAMMKP